MKISIKHEIKELEREVSMRQRVYPEWIRTGKIRRDEADYRVRVLISAIKRLKLMDRFLESRQLGLFTAPEPGMTEEKLWNQIGSEEL